MLVKQDMICPKRILSICTIAIFPLIFISCRKDEPIPDDPNKPYCECCDSVDAPDFVSAGDTTAMWVQTINEKLNFDWNQDTIFIDPENDGENDFLIITLSYTTMGGGLYHSYGWIQANNDSSFLSYSSQTDTLYNYYTTTYSGTNPVYKSIIYHTNCQPLTCCDNIYSISNELNYYQNNDIINLDNTWGVQLGFFETGYELTEGSGPEINDTVTLNGEIYNPTCTNIPSSSATYIGFKKINCGKEKLGWMKFTFDSGINIKQVAVQK